MRASSVRIIVARETLLLALIVVVAIGSIGFLEQIRVEQINKTNSINGFLNTIERDQDNILLQALLGRADELDDYAERVAVQFQSVDFCFVVNSKAIPKLSRLRRQCKDSQKYKQLYKVFGKEEIGISYEARRSSFFKRSVAILFTPSVLLALALSLTLSLFLYLRLRQYLSLPLEDLNSELTRIASGAREIRNIKLPVSIEWKAVHEALVALVQHIVELERLAPQAARVEVARRVAHDIRSPLSALNIVASLASADGKRDLMFSAIRRINEIADDLLTSTKGDIILGAASPTLESMPISLLIGEIVAEKRVSSSRDATLDWNCKSPFETVWTDSVQFQRVIANLIQNGLEAQSNSAYVSVELVAENDFVDVIIKDNGPGISPEIIEQAQLGVNITTKTAGSGIGLSHAFSAIDSWNGKLSFSSEGPGTTVRVRLPRALPPHWFTTSISLNGMFELILVDDDPSIAKAWEALIANKGFSEKLKLHYFSSPDSLRAWLQRQDFHESQGRIFIIDYDLGNGLKGSELILETLIYKEVILVSGREDLEFLKFVSTQKFRYLPKSLLSQIAIN